jgi:hypothetical protein
MERFNRSTSFNAGNSILNNDQIRAVAPSVFAERPYHSVSEKYRFIPTSAVLDRLLREGWLVTQAFENRVKLADKRGFTKHRLVLKHADSRPIADGSAPRIMLTNGHDRSSSYIIEAGFFRMICANGLVVSTGDFGRVSVPHVGNRDLAERVLEGTYRVVGDMEKISAKAQSMGQIMLSQSEQLVYAEAARTVRWDGNAPVEAEQLLLTRRGADRTDDLWTTYNRVQENIIRGGLHGVNAKGKRHTTRGVNSINEDTRVNRALWQLAESMAALKAA